MPSHAEHEAYSQRLKAAAVWCRRNFRRRYDRHSHPSFLASDLLKEATKRYDLGGFGVEGFTFPDSSVEGCSYVNQGDTYSLTLLCITDRHTARFQVGSWGDVAETLDRNEES